jgi:hypothetical protein
MTELAAISGEGWFCKDTPKSLQINVLIGSWLTSAGLHSQKSYPKVIENIIQKPSSFFDFHNLQAEAEAHHPLVVLLGLTTPAMSIILACVVCYSFPLCCAIILPNGWCTGGCLLDLSPQSPFFWHGTRLVIEEWKLGNMENQKHGFYMIRLKVCGIK